MEAPSEKIFEEMKNIAIQIWSDYDNTYGYVSQKMEYINSIKNIEDNAMIFYRMFDPINQSKMALMLSKEAIVYTINNF